MTARLAALRVARRARPADVGPQPIERARDRLTDDAHERRAAGARASHAALSAANELARDAVEPGFGFQRKARPVGRIGTARAARPAQLIAVQPFDGGERACPRNVRRGSVCDSRERPG